MDTEIVKVDREKWTKAYKTRRLSQQEISKGIGHGQTYLSYWVHNLGKLPIEDVRMIEKEYHIRSDEYVLNKDTNKSYPVDKGKLIDKLKTKGKNLSEASREMNRSVSYLSQKIKKDEFNIHIVNFIKNTYGIEYEEYKQDEIKEKCETTNTTTYDSMTLGKVIEDAVINALIAVGIDALPEKVLEAQSQLFERSGLMNRDEILSLFPKDKMYILNEKR